MTPEWMEEIENIHRQTIREVEAWMGTQDLDPRLFAPRRTTLRFLVLRTWAMRTRISIGEILSILVPVLKRIRGKRRSGRYSRTNGAGRVGEGLPVSIPTLTSRRAWGLLCEELAKKYPNREELAEWREMEKDRQLALEARERGEIVREVKRSVLSYPDTHSFAAAYVKRVGRERAERSAKESALWRTRKNYRNNPWR